MAFLDKTNKTFKTDEKFEIEVTLVDGSIVIVNTKNETIQKGDKVYKDDGTPIEDGEYLTEDDANTITVVSGVIVKVVEGLK